MALLVSAIAMPMSALGRAAPRARKAGAAAAKHAPAEQARLERAAKLRYQRGTRAYNAGNYRLALQQYQAAAELVWRPSLSYNIALCHDKLKEFNLAILALRRYLASKPPAAWALRTRKWIRILMTQARCAVRVTSYPSGAAVFVGSRKLGVRGRTPADLSLKPGRYKMLLEATGHEPAVRTVTVDVGAPNYFDFQLKRRSALKVAASVRGALVSIDGGSKSLAPIQRVVRPGRHRVEVEREGYYTVTRVVQIAPGEQATVFVDLRPLPRYGVLQVKSNVAGARVWVESSDAGETPLKKHRLRVGTYRIYVKRDGYQTWEQRVTILNRQVTSITVHLNKRRSRRQMAWFIAGTTVTGLLLAGGLVFTLTAINAKTEYDSLPTASLRRKGQQLALAADGLFASGIVIGVITAFLVWRLKPAKSRGEVTVTPMIGPGFTGLSAGGRF